MLKSKKNKTAPPHLYISTSLVYKITEYILMLLTYGLVDAALVTVLT